MISFVWSDPLPVYSGRGGSESFTIGQVRELLEQKIDSRIITVGLGQNDGRQFFPDIPFHDILSIKELEDLDDTLVFVSRPHAVKTRNKSFAMLHSQPPVDPALRNKYKRALQDKIVITNSRFCRRLWAEYLNISTQSIRVVYPFADPSFAAVRRPKHFIKPLVTSVLYAGRLTPEKGVYTLLQSLHHSTLRKGIRLSITTAGNQTKDGAVIEQFLQHHPWVRLIEAKHTPARMAALFATHQIVVMPSNPTYWTEDFGYWRETFGMISIEAQHAGCYVVASNDGGLPETDCGGLILFEPANSYSLALAVRKIASSAPLTARQRREATKHFTRAESVNALLAILKPHLVV